MKVFLSENKKFLWGVFLLFAVSALAYLPLVHKIGYLADDWYLMYEGFSQGADYLPEVWKIDRPGRSLLMVPMVKLFGFGTFWYHISAYLFRFLGGVSLFWTLNLIWKDRKLSNLLAALLFTVYPGFLAQTNAIDYQSHIAALFFALFSVSLSVKAFFVEKPSSRILLIAGAILFGWAYLSQMEYFISFEVFRMVLIFLLISRKEQGNLLRKGLATLRVWLPNALIAGGFLVWRAFFFENTRRATDVGYQLSQFISSPLTALWSLVHFLQDILNVLVIAWAYPLYIFGFQLRLRDSLVGLFLAAFAVFLLWALFFFITKNEDDEDESDSVDEHPNEAYWLGFVTIVGGLLPVILVNRHIIYPDYSRYSLVASVGVAIVFAQIISVLKLKKLRMAIAGMLVFLSVLTHHGNSVYAATLTEATNDFWWQVSWRAPDIQNGTTLLASYPNSAIGEDYIVWGPANLIYRPEKQEEIPIEILIPSAIMNNDIVLSVMSGKGGETDLGRGNHLSRDFDNTLLMAQAAPGACVRIIDGNAPELSSADSHRVMLVAPQSKIDNVIVNASPSMPPTSIFGAEPAKKWCYYYQKASLARQKGDWEKVISLFERGLDEGYYPVDSVEWLPLLEAYAITGQEKKLRPYVSIMNAEPLLASQACSTLSNLAQDQELKTYIEKKFCE